MRALQIILGAGVAITIPALLSATTWHVPSVECPAIQIGIDQATTGDTVLVAPGTYEENLVMQGIEDEVILMSESGWEVTIIDGTSSSRVIYCSDVGGGAVIRGFTITNGHIGGVGDLQDGGGIYCETASPRIIANNIFNNFAESGGGIGSNFNASPHIQDNRITNNSAVGDGGGVLFNNGSPVVIGNEIVGNTTGFGTPGYGAGGGIAGAWGAPHVAGNLIAENTASEGSAGIYFGNDCDGLIENNVIRDNVAVGVYGGGIRCREGSSPTIRDNLIVGNSTSGGGGGILVDSSNPAILGNTIVGNSAADGAGVYVLNGWVTMHNNIVVDNSPGGGVVVVEGMAGLSCNDVWNNLDADYVNCEAGPGDFSEDPLFCDPEYGDYTLALNSPCVEGYGCGQVGAYGVGCGSTRTESTTWGSLKALYR
jgi:parallel beta-helix repeat protein